MPALLTRMSMLPNAATAVAMQAPTCVSSVTSMATPMALPVPPSSDAATSAPAWLRSPMTTLAPSRAKVRAISLPMPLAAPVTTATLFLRRMGTFPLILPQVIVDDLTETERQVGKDVLRRDDFHDGQFGDGRQSVRHQRQRARTRPRTFDRDVFEIIFHQFAYPRRAVDMRDDLEEEVRRGKRGLDRLAI